MGLSSDGGEAMRATLVDQIQAWLDDPESSVEYSEELEGRWAVRMRQQTRDATTVWFTVGERSLEYEAFVFPLPPEAGSAAEPGSDPQPASVARLLCHRPRGRPGACGAGSRRAQVTTGELELALGEIYDTIEVSFRPLLAALAKGAKNPVRNL